MRTATAEMLTEAPKGKPTLVEPASDKRKTLFKAQDEAPAPAIRLIDKMPPPQARPGNLIMNLTNELLNKLKSQCEPLAPGARRDWAKLAEVINECHGKLYGNLERRQIDRERANQLSAISHLTRPHRLQRVQWRRPEHRRGQDSEQQRDRVCG